MASFAAEQRLSALRRLPERAVLGGVCAGVAERFGVSPLVVRVLAAATLTASGIGLPGYALAWALIPPAQLSATRPRQGRARAPATLIAALLIAAIASVATGALPIRDWLAWSLPLGLLAIATLLGRELQTAVPLAAASGPAGRAPELRRRLLEGGRALLVLAIAAVGAVVLLHGFGVQRNFVRALDSALIIGSVLALAVAPRFVALGRSLAAERAERIRAQERAELAAHLHDSVLQTLSLIQRRAPDAGAVAALARQQERELRSWLYGRSPSRGASSAHEALSRAAAEVEERHRAAIEVVVVGERALDERAEAVVKATREALTNAAKFAPGARIDLYAELAPERIEVFVRDRGPGFDPSAIASDRHGIRESIIGRMQRSAGEALIRTAPGAGTEVELRIPAALGGARPSGR